MRFILLLLTLGALLLGFSPDASAGVWISCKEVVGKVSVGGGEFVDTKPVMVCDFQDDGLGDFDFNGEWTGSGGGGDNTVDVCSSLGLQKPGGCTDPVAPPSGANYGQGTYAGGSALAKLIYLKDSGLMLPASSRIIDSALATHTLGIANRFVPYSTVNAQLMDSVKSACQYQTDYAMAGAYGTSKCADAFSRLTQEAGDPNFSSWFSNWLSTNHLDVGLGPLSLQSLANALAPENSLTAKQEAVTQHAKCADWWSISQTNGCVN